MFKYQLLLLYVEEKCQGFQPSDVALLQIFSWYGSQRVRGQEEGREGHGRGRWGQAGWDRDDGWSVWQWAITSSPHIDCAGVSGGVKKHRRRVRVVWGQVCRQKIHFRPVNDAVNAKHHLAGKCIRHHSYIPTAGVWLKSHQATSFISAFTWQQTQSAPVLRHQAAQGQ